MSDVPDELSELRRRLAESEETLRAIREGEVDALVVGRPDQPQIFSIGGDTEAFRTFLEVMDIGAAAVDERGCILYSNTVFASLVGRLPATLQGVPLNELLCVERRMTEALLGEEITAPHTVQIDWHTPDGPRFLLVSGRPLRLGTVSGHAVTLTDITDRILSERAEQNERTAQAILASANEAVMVCDAQGIVTHGNQASRTICTADPVGRRLADVLPLRLPEEHVGVRTVSELLGAVMAGAPVQGVEVFLPQLHGQADFLLSAAPLLVEDRAGGGCVVTMMDLSQRKQAEKQQLLLMNELDHRVKNALAMVLAICRKTLRNASDLEDFGTVFTARVQALAATHNLLAKNAWKGLTVRDVAVAELSPFMEIDGGKIDVQGLEQVISAEAAVALGLIFHELATNAVKYGALSVEDGRIAIHAISGEPEGALVLEWREFGGPLVGAPLRQGFGATVITQSLQFAHGGNATLDYQPEGLICTLTLPADHVRNQR